MDECAACGARVDATATYCDDCADEGSARSTTASHAREATGAAGRTDRDGGAVASPTRRAVAALLALAAVGSAFTFAQSLAFLPEALRYFRAVQTVGFLVNQTVDLALVVAFAVGAKRLVDGTADAAQYGRALQGLAVASAVLTVVGALAPRSALRWVPSFLDPGGIVLNVGLRYLGPGAIGVELALVAVGGVGAIISVVAGRALATAD